LKNYFSGSSKKKSLSELRGRRILVTAGPTYEPFDAVRFIGNYSSGKMGFAIAEALAEQGANVTLVSGPVALLPQHAGIIYYPVHTASEMLARSLACFPDTDGAILSAAVSDYRPKSPVAHKIKRNDENMVLELEPNPDIARHLGNIKQPGQFLAGFALETDDEIRHASEKLKKKNFDFIVLNSLRDKGSGFMGDTNKITIIGKDNKITPFELKSKKDTAQDIIQYLDNFLSQ
jgi:phosphopantothenoylcysteine decarboxylase/phosphopantothenate--cysteine ligase